MSWWKNKTPEKENVVMEDSKKATQQNALRVHIRGDDRWIDLFCDWDAEEEAKKQETLKETEDYKEYPLCVNPWRYFYSWYFDETTNEDDSIALGHKDGLYVIRKREIKYFEIFIRDIK